jgi:hypothetical protein
LTFAHPIILCSDGSAVRAGATKTKSRQNLSTKAASVSLSLRLVFDGLAHHLKLIGASDQETILPQL